MEKIGNEALSALSLLRCSLVHLMNYHSYTLIEHHGDTTGSAIFFDGVKFISLFTSIAPTFCISFILY